MVNVTAYPRIALIYLGVIIVGLQPCGAAENGEGAVLETFDIPTDGHPLLVPVKINGETYRFSVDTAASHTVFDHRLKQLLGNSARTISMRSGRGEVQLELYDAPEIYLGKLQAGLASSHAICADLSVYRLGTGDNVQGMLGMGFLRAHVVRLDFDHGKLLFLATSGNDAGERVALSFEPNATYVRAKVADDIDASFAVCTGLLTWGALRKDLVADLKNRGVLTLLGERTGGDIGGPMRSQLYELASLRLAAFEHSQLRFTSNTEVSTNALALPYLARYIVTFDFPNSVMYLKPSRNFARTESDPPPGTGTWGLQLSCLRGEIAVLGVRGGGPASQAGVRVSDVLLAVDGTDVTVPLDFSVHRLFCTDAKTIRLTLKRLEGIKELTLTVPESAAAIPASKPLRRK